GTERIDDGVDGRLGGGDGARLPDTLGPERVRWARRDRAVEHEAGQLRRRGHQVVGQRRGQQVAVLVVDRLLEQRLGQALHDPAVDLPLDDERVDLVAAVVDGDVVQQVDLPGLLVDLDDADVRAEREREVRRVVRRLGRQV